MTLHALIVAHGQPNDPAPAEAELARLARLVAQDLPGWTVASATLADADAMKKAVAGQGGVVFPLFMAGGWFSRVNLPARIMQAGAAAGAWQVLEPFGCAPALHALASVVLAEALADAGWQPQGTALVLAAHGSGRSPVPADVARHVLQGVRATLPFARAEVALIDQAPRLADLQGFGGQSLCLPYFAAGGGHVTVDIPAALQTCGFGGRLLPPIGADPRVPALIAALIAAGRAICAADCRFRAG